jgi:hypothetical protein
MLEKTNSPSFITLFNNTVSAALFNYSKLRILVSMVSLPIMVTVVKQWAKNWTYYYTSMVSTIIRELCVFHGYQT